MWMSRSHMLEISGFFKQLKLTACLRSDREDRFKYLFFKQESIPEVGSQF